MTKFLKQFFVNISQKALFVTQKAVYFTQKSQKSQNFFSAYTAVVPENIYILKVPQKSQKWQKWGYAPSHADCIHNYSNYI